MSLGCWSHQGGWFDLGCGQRELSLKLLDARLEDRRTPLPEGGGFGPGLELLQVGRTDAGSAVQPAVGGDREPHHCRPDAHAGGAAALICAPGVPEGGAAVKAVERSGKGPQALRNLG
jgi:hypothetical protein